MILRSIVLLVLVSLISAGIFLFRDPTIALMWRQNSSTEIEALHGQGIVDSLQGRQSSIQAGSNYLIGILNEEGWEGHPGITAICLRSVAGVAEPQDLQPAIDFLLSCQSDDGSFAIPFSVGVALRNYTTAVAILGLAALENPRYDDNISRARDFLKKAQLDEGEGVSPESPHYGGFGYGMGKKADLSNVHFALDALSQAGVAADDPVFQRAQAFLRNVQDGEGQSWGEGSGGFVYAPPGEEPEKAVPYGAMSFSGLKSLLLSDVPKEDERVQDVLHWIGKNFSLEEHPGRGQLSIYYYYATLGTTLNKAGMEAVELHDGAQRPWKSELAVQLMERQRKDGSWMNPNRKYMEGLPTLATAYALLALRSTTP